MSGGDPATERRAVSVREVESRGFDARADGGAPDASPPRPRKLATFAKLVGRSARPRLRCRMDARSRYAAPHMVRRLSGAGRSRPDACGLRSEEHTSELQSLMRISYA